ncbi:hypothetical protein OPV22_021639 [Ensete ventricosum]|uniref:Uncharacterized protein n=1 Tax=Ensete ventricosum TaxID=4639 RepID=A0AAV8QHK4_ENSVE|nr:hypothetical protein OPV22_021639 [Ensete ventricosum]
MDLLSYVCWFAAGEHTPADRARSVQVHRGRWGRAPDAGGDEAGGMGAALRRSCAVSLVGTAASQGQSRKFSSRSLEKKALVMDL